MPKKHGHSPFVGKTYKKCPHSTAYKTDYYDQGYLGNSTNPNLPVTTSDHDYTEGTMVMAQVNGLWGWRCIDDNCYFFTTYGRRYFES